jgi:O-antigen/teichoic acid export membrane protein
LLTIAAHYGSGLFGQLTLAISVVEIFRTLSEFGIDTVTVASFSRESDQRRRDSLGAVLGTKICLAFIFYVIAAATIWPLAKSYTVMVFGAVSAISLLTVNIIGAFTSYLQSQLRMGTSCACTAAAWAIYLPICLYSIHIRAPLILVIALLPACEAANALLLYLFGATRPRIRFNLKYSLSLLRHSLPLGLMAAMTIICFRLDNILLFKISGAESLGVYSAAYRIVEPALMVPHAFGITLLAVLSAGSNKVFGRTLHAVVMRSMWPAYIFVMLASAGLLIFAPTVLTKLAASYLAGTGALQVLAVTLIIRTCNITTSIILLSRGAYAALARITATNLVVNATAAFLLIMYFGVVGAAVAALVTECWNLAAQGYCLNKRSDRFAAVSAIVQPVQEIIF